MEATTQHTPGTRRMDSDTSERLRRLGLEIEDAICEAESLAIDNPEIADGFNNLADMLQPNVAKATQPTKE